MEIKTSVSEIVTLFKEIQKEPVYCKLKFPTFAKDRFGRNIFVGRYP